MQALEKICPTCEKIMHDEDCYFCRSKDEKPEPVENNLEDQAAEDTAAYDGPLNNSSDKLGNALGAEPAKRSIDGIDIVVAAHHLIPGNEALKESTLKQNNHLWEHGIKKGNIGYDINSKKNGVWLPGPYAKYNKAVEKRKIKGEKGWTAMTPAECQAYAIEAMKKHNAQFHDRHYEYSKFVQSVLDKIAEKLEQADDLGCPEAPKQKKKSPEEKFPVKSLVGRLNQLSARFREMLTEPDSGKWRKNVYTSGQYGPKGLAAVVGRAVTQEAKADDLAKEIGF